MKVGKAIKNSINTASLHFSFRESAHSARSETVCEHLLMQKSLSHNQKHTHTSSSIIDRISGVCVYGLLFLPNFYFVGKFKSEASESEKMCSQWLREGEKTFTWNVYLPNSADRNKLRILIKPGWKETFCFVFVVLDLSATFISALKSYKPHKMFWKQNSFDWAAISVNWLYSRIVDCLCPCFLLSVVRGQQVFLSLFHLSTAFGYAADLID